MLAIAFLFPSQFQHWYLAQAQQHAQHITDELASTLLRADEPQNANRWTPAVR